MNETDIDALVHKFSPEEWSVKIREEMNRLGLYFEGDETEMNEKAEKQAKEKLDKWLREIGAEVEDGDKSAKVSGCDSGACDISKGGK